MYPRKLHLRSGRIERNEHLDGDSDKRRESDNWRESPVIYLSIPQPFYLLASASAAHPTP